MLSRGVIAYVKIVNGTVRKGDLVKFIATEKQYSVDEVGVLKMGLESRESLSAGDVGYVISGIKTAREIKVGDTVTNVKTAL